VIPSRCDSRSSIPVKRIRHDEDIHSRSRIRSGIIVQRSIPYEARRRLVSEEVYKPRILWRQLYRRRLTIGLLHCEQRLGSSCGTSQIGGTFSSTQIYYSSILTVLQNHNSFSNGRPWPSYVAQYSGANVYNYAVSGAACSNDVTPVNFPAINGPYPAVEQYEIPAYIADSKYVDEDGTNFLNTPPDETVYSIFIGTNDLGNYALLTDEQQPGTNIVNYTDCVVRALGSIYDNGGRHFVLQNVAPLNLSPQYGLPGKGGLPTSQYWLDKSSNTTEISYKMAEYVSLVNAVYKYQTPYLFEVAKRFPGAHIALMDMHGLVSRKPQGGLFYQQRLTIFFSLLQITDIYNNPSQYLNGSAPLNVTGFASSDMKAANTTDKDSFLWYDELHPGEQADRVIAREFLGVVAGDSKWATYWSG
jgi:hypothetical protein